MSDITPFEDPLSHEVWFTKFRDPSETKVEQMWRRVAKGLASCETTQADRDLYEEKYYEFLSKFNTMAGRILSNTGTDAAGTTPFNCFILGPRLKDHFKDKGVDSLEGIMEMVKEQAITLKSEGGYGTNLSHLRPRGAFIKGIKSESCGPISFADIWNTVADTITQGSGTKKDKRSKSSIRKGAMMLVLAIWHPSILEFITAKTVGGRLDKFNISVGMTDEFMEAVEKDTTFDLEFPNTEFEKYNAEWFGDITEWKSKGYPVVKYETVKARELYDTIVNSTYNRNEPGILFLTRANKRNNLWYCERIIGTNPCVTGDTLVYTTEGLKRIRSLVGTNARIIVDGRFQDTVQVFARNIIKTGIRPVYRLQTKEGYYVRATADHRIMTSAGWTRLQDIRPGDKIHILNSGHRGNGFGSTGSIEMGRVLGWTIGDGTINHRVHKVILSFFGAEKREIGPLFQDHIRVLQDGTIPAIVSIPKRDEVRIQSTKIYPALEQQGVTAVKLRVPESVFTGNKDMQKGFLQSLFTADGGFQGSQAKGGSIRLASISQELLEGTQQLLLNFGIASTIYRARRPAGYRKLPNSKRKPKAYWCQEQHELVVTKRNMNTFASEIGFLMPYKQRLLQSYISNGKRGTYSETYLATVESITKHGNEEVYDLTEPMTHSFVANGIVVHNCGEQCGPDGLVCDLGSLNLINYINSDRSDWDYEKLGQDIPVQIRMLDAVNTIGRAPLEIQRENMASKRRVGEGILGFGSAMMIMRVRYGSKKCLDLTEKFAKFWANTAYKASAILAKEKGAFPLYDKDKYLQSEYLKCLDSETIDLIKKHGMRNSHVLSIAPTGSTGAYANNVSGGLEPVIFAEYTRTVAISITPDGLQAPDKKSVDWSDQSKKYKAYDQSSISQENAVYWDWIKEGDENLLRCRYQGIVYKIDRNRGLTKEMECNDYAVRKLKAEDKWDPKAIWAATSEELTIDEHISVMKVFAKYVDSAISKTIGIPNDYPYEKFKNVYMDAWKTGYIKGITTYRAGTMANVMKAKGAKDKEVVAEIPKSDAPKRPESLNAQAYTFVVKGSAYYVVIGLMNEEPFEIFTGMNLTKDEELYIPKWAKAGKLIKKGSREYAYLVMKEDKKHEFSLTNGHSDPTADGLTRMISLALRHGADVAYVVQQLEKTAGDMTTFAKVLGRALKKYIAEGHEGGDTCEACGSKNVKRVGGCRECKDCGWSGC